jgi:hypothetical protein
MAKPSLQSRYSQIKRVNQRRPHRLILGITGFGFIVVAMALQPPGFIWLLFALATLAMPFTRSLSRLSPPTWLQRIGGWRTGGVLAGSLVFLGITLHGDPATAQLFNSAEQEANTIFGQYIDGNIISFLFGMLRIVIWIAAVGFVMFAVYQAQRGEQWQPLMQNAFIVVAAVVVVEGLSTMFFGGG